MRRTKIGLFLVMCVAVLSMLTACGGGSMSNVDPAQAEKTVLSTVNKALGTEFANEESLRNKANVVWEKVDQTGRISLNYTMFAPEEGANGEKWMVRPMIDSDSFDSDAMFRMVAITAEQLKNFENPSAELLARVKRDVEVTAPGYKLNAVCVTAKNIGGQCIYRLCDGNDTKVNNIGCGGQMSAAQQKNTRCGCSGCSLFVMLYRKGSTSSSSLISSMVPSAKYQPLPYSASLPSAHRTYEPSGKARKCRFLLSARAISSTFCPSSR